MTAHLTRTRPGSGVADLVGVRRGETVYDFVDAVPARRLAESVGMIPHLLSGPGNTGVRLVSSLGAALTGVALARAPLARGAPGGAPRRGAGARALGRRRVGGCGAGAAVQGDAGSAADGAARLERGSRALDARRSELERNGTRCRTRRVAARGSAAQGHDAGRRGRHRRRRAARDGGRGKGGGVKLGAPWDRGTGGRSALLVVTLSVPLYPGPPVPRLFAQDLPAIRTALQLAAEGRSDSARRLVEAELRRAHPGDAAHVEALYFRARLATYGDSAERALRRVAIEFSTSRWADDALLQLAQLAMAAGNPASALTLAERPRRDYPGSELRARAGFWAGRAGFDVGGARAACALLDSAQAEAAGAVG